MRIRESMAERELQLELTDPAKDLLVEKGWDPAMGARPLRRAIQRYIEDPLADFVLREQLMPGATVVVNPAPDGEEGEVRLTIVKPKKQKTPVGVGAGAASRRSGPRRACSAARWRGRGRQRRRALLRRRLGRRLEAPPRRSSRRRWAPRTGRRSRIYQAGIELARAPQRTSWGAA